MKFVRWFFQRSLFFKLVILVILGGAGYVTYSRFAESNTQSVQYLTAAAEKGTLVVSVSASGTVTAVNSASVTTESSGVITNVFVKDGDRVKSGDKIVEVELDLEGKQRANQAYASYQGAKNTLDSANTKLYTLQADMFGKWDEFKELAEGDDYKDVTTANRNLPEFHIPEKEWLAAESTYKNQQGVISQAKTALDSSWRTYQLASPVIYAPISGTVTGLSLQIGSVITTTRSSSSNTATAQKVASIKTDAPALITLNLTEIDTPKVKVGKRATITFDALPDKTFTGQVVSVDTIGSVSSGVTTYPTVVVLDTQSPDILPNMAASAAIIIETKDNVLMVPYSAVQIADSESTVSILRNGQPVSVTVETGLSSDSQIEVVSGISEGDEVVTSSIPNGTSGTSGTQGSSPFSSFGGGGMRVISGGGRR